MIVYSTHRWLISALVAPFLAAGLLSTGCCCHHSDGDHHHGPEKEHATAIAIDNDASSTQTVSYQRRVHPSGAQQYYYHQVPPQQYQIPVQGPQGNVGPRGPAGPRGPQGKPGVIAEWEYWEEIYFVEYTGRVRDKDVRKYKMIADYMAQYPSLQIGLDVAIDPKNPVGGTQQLNVVRGELIAAGMNERQIVAGEFGDPSRRRDGRVEVLLRTAPEWR